MLDEIRRLLNEPDPLLCLGEAARRLGAWRTWTIERQVRFLRVRFEVTQSELSWRCGVSQDRISRIEAGADFKFSTVRRLWGGLGYEPILMPVALTRPGTSEMAAGP